ncbi:MAG: TonB-dependent receptor [Candidatus Brocadiia bacterium]
MYRFLFIVTVVLSISWPAVWAAEPVKSSEEVVVTARRTPQQYSEVTGNVTVISSEQLSYMPVNDLAGALNLVNGVDLQGRGPSGQPTSVTIQGCDPRHVRIMVDGVLINSQGMAFADPSLIPIENVERIEIIKGTTSSVWGSSLGGVINVILKKPQTNQLVKTDFTSGGGWGDYGFWKQDAQVSGRMDKLGYLVWAGYLDSNNEFRTNSAVLSQKGGFKLSYETSNVSNLEANFQYYNSDVGGYEFDLMGYGEKLRHILKYGSVRFGLAPDPNSEFSAALKFSDHAGRIIDYAVPGDTQLSKNATRDVFSGLDLQYRLNPAKGQTVLVGADLGRDKLESDMMVGKEQIQRQGYYVNYSLSPLDRVDVNLGLRYDDNEAYGDQLSPSAGVIWHTPFKQTDLRLSVARAFNAPPLIYKYIANNPFVLPNPDIKAERAPAVYEFSAETRPLNNLWFKLALYRAEVSDYLAYDPVAMMMDNISRVRRQGVEAETRYDFTKGLQAQAGWSFNRVQDRDTGQIIQGNGVAKVTYNMGVNYKYNDNLNAGLKGNYRFWNERALLNPSDRKFIWDMRVNYSLDKANEAKGPKLSAYAYLLNIFNRKYWNDEFLPMPGRQLEAGLNYGF